MRTLLHIDSSPRSDRSHSRRLTSLFTRAWRAAHPEGCVIYRIEMRDDPVCKNRPK